MFFPLPFTLAVLVATRQLQRVPCEGAAPVPWEAAPPATGTASQLAATRRWMHFQSGRGGGYGSLGSSGSE